MRALGFSIVLVVVGLCSGRDLLMRQKRDDLFSGVGNLIQQLIGGGNNNNGRPAPPIDPNTGKANYCDRNPADCEYVNCQAENFQKGENSKNLQMGSKLFTDPALRRALQTDPTISQAACDKIGLDAKGCDGFKSFLGLIDRVAPGDNGDPRDPNRGKRSPNPAPGTGLGLGVGTNTQVDGNGAGIGVGANTNVGANPQSNRNRTPKPTTPKPHRGPNPPKGNGGRGSGKGSIDYTDYYDHDGSGHGGSGGGNNGPAFVPRDCSIYLPRNLAGNGNGQGNNGGNNRGNNGGNNRGNNGGNGNKGNGNRGNNGRGPITNNRGN